MAWERTWTFASSQRMKSPSRQIQSVAVSVYMSSSRAVWGRRQHTANWGQSHESSFRCQGNETMIHDSDPNQPSVQKVRRYLAAVLGQFSHDLLVQPDVHWSRVVHVARVAELTRELSALCQ